MPLKSQMRRGAVDAALIVLGIAVTSAAGPQLGLVTSPGKFRVDGSEVANSATIFEGNRVDTGGFACTLKRSGGGTVQVEPQSSAQFAQAATVLMQGQLRIQDGSGLTIPGAEVHFKPVDASAVVRAQFSNGQLVVDLLKGTAQLNQKNNDLYARLREGTRMQFPLDSAQSLGVDLLATGCLHRNQNHWYLKAEHISGEVELLNGTIEKERRRIEVRGVMQSLNAKSDSLAALVQVISEKEVPGSCPAAFVPIVGDVVTGGVAVSAIIPIIQSSRVSVP